MGRQRTVAKRIHDHAIYAAIGCALVAWIVYGVSSHLSSISIGKFALAFFVGVVVVGESSRTERRQLKFWLALAVLLEVHFLLAPPAFHLLEGTSVWMKTALLLVDIVLMQTVIAVVMHR